MFFFYFTCIFDGITLFFFRKYEFALDEVEGFRYRSRDAWRAVTRIAVREARLKEIKQELLNCKKLQVCGCYFVLLA